jgi:hypothetical protein
MLREKQAAIVAHLEADAFFSAIPVVAAIKGNLASIIETELGKLGRVVTVEPLRGPFKHAGGALSTEPGFSIHIFENVLINRVGETYVTAEDIMEKIAYMLRSGQTTPPPVYAQSWELVNDLSEELTYRIDATTRGAVVIEIPEAP